MFIPIEKNKPADRIFGRTGAIAYRMHGDKIEVKCKAFGSKEEFIVDLPGDSIEGLKKWIDGELIQNALPSVSVDVRECLISGMRDWPEEPEE